MLRMAPALRRLRGLSTLAPKAPRHRSRPRTRPVQPPEACGGAAQEVMPTWLFEEQPVWLEALLRFLQEPDVLLVRLGGAGQRRRPACGRLPELEELGLPLDGLRAWAREQLAAGRASRPLALLAPEVESAKEAQQLLRSMGFQRVANLHTQVGPRVAGRFLARPSWNSCKARADKGAWRVRGKCLFGAWIKPNQKLMRATPSHPNTALHSAHRCDGKRQWLG